VVVTEARAHNRLFHETSPYLLQHAHNPVDWYPWGEEALERARAEGKPILLSVGYAACHWCHVMERESFEDSEIARLMNAEFVCIKVDREERPDIDAVYMDALQAMTGSGGWPMTMFLTPQGAPFFGGTYFPPQDRHGLPSFRKVLEGVGEAWRTKRDEISRQGDQVVDHIRRQTAPAPSAEPLHSSLFGQAVAAIGEMFDAVNGGFGGPPKFPQAPLLELMLRACYRQVPQAREMTTTTLEKMARGGIYDQVGGGFHRYSVDGIWLVPHFEKMLYDNAQLLRVYARAYQVSGSALFRRVGVETAEYLLRDLRDPGGAFYASEDADSEGVEGKFYVWSYKELEQVAPGAAAALGARPEGNFEGANILTAPGDAAADQMKAALLDARSRRVRPERDEKILVSWNGLAIAALAEAGAIFNKPELIEAAAEAASFLLEHGVVAGRLMHSYKDGRAKVPGMLEDYAFFAEGLMALWETTFEPRWIEGCRQVAEQMIELFWDENAGGLFSTGNDHEKLIVRQIELTESAVPSPNAVAASVLRKLSVLNGDENHSAKATAVLRLARTYLERIPAAVPSFLCDLDSYLNPATEIAIIGPRDDPATQALVRKVWETHLPNKVVAGSPPGIESPLLEGKQMISGAPTAYVCENYACRAPATDPEEFGKQLAGRQVYRGRA
jgi:uncharacterized protein